MRNCEKCTDENQDSCKNSGMCDAPHETSPPVVTLPCANSESNKKISSPAEDEAVEVIKKLENSQSISTSIQETQSSTGINAFMDNQSFESTNLESQLSISSYQPDAQDEAESLENDSQRDVSVSVTKKNKRFVGVESPGLKTHSLTTSPKTENDTDFNGCQSDEINPKNVTKVLFLSNSILFVITQEIFVVDESLASKFYSVANPYNVEKLIVYWCPPHKLKQIHQLQVFPDQLNPCDIIQQRLNNCWIAAAVASLAATRPDLIKNIMRTEKWNKEGIYLQFFDEGIEWLIFINYMLLCDENGNVVFGQVKNGLLYFPLIEKGFAKYYGGYPELEFGRPSVALYTMTGLPCSTLKISGNLDILWNIIFDAKQAVFPMVVASDKENDNLKKVSLNPSHAYSVLDVKEVNLGKLFHSVKLLKLRDPLGCSSWKGDWSDDSELWSQYPNLRCQLNPNPNLSKEGKFWISFDDFSNYFVYVDICKARKDWIIRHKYVDILKSSAKPMKEFFLTVYYYETEIFFNAFLQSPNPMQSPLPTRHPVEASISIYLFRDYEEPALVKSTTNQMRKHLSYEYSLNPGKYKLRVEVNRLTDEVQHINTISGRYFLHLVLFSSKVISFYDHDN